MPLSDEDRTRPRRAAQPLGQEAPRNSEDATLVRGKTPSDPSGPVQPTPAEALLGTVIEGRYRIDSVIAAGGMGRVYRGIHVRTGSTLAIKLMDPELSKDPTMKARCLEEARALMGIQSNHIVKALDVGELPGGQLYLIMEYLEGEDLDRLLTREGPIPWSRAAHMAVQICAGLASAHRRGIIHRDIKPQNCVRVETDDNPDHIRIIDFGIARRAGGETGLTKEGFLLGTPEYLAPEFALGAKASISSDIYALGVTLYKLLTCRVPFKGETGIDTLEQHVRGTLVLPSQAAPQLEIPLEADRIVAKALAKTPSERFASAEEMSRALRAALGIQHSGLLTPPSSQAKPATIQASSSAQSAQAPKPQTAQKEVAPPAAVEKPRIDRRLLALRLMSLVLVSTLFVVGTWLVAPPDIAETPQPQQRLQQKARPTLAQASGHAKKESATPKSQAPEASPAEAIRVEQTPDASKGDSGAAPGAGEGNGVAVPIVAQTPPAAPSVAEPQVEPDFNYAEAAKLVEDEHVFLRKTCMTKGEKPVSRLKFRIDVKPSGQSKVGVHSSSAEVRACVRQDLGFRYPRSPRGGAFEYTLTATDASLKRMPVDPSFVQVQSP